MGHSVNKSKRLTYILRHAPEAAKVTLDHAGWADVAELLAGTGWDRITLDELVAENEKKRFEYSTNGTKIRAVQGHSVDVDLEYPLSVPPPILYHGTSDPALPSIFRYGLKPMNRRHVHLSATAETANMVGARHGTPVVIQVAAEAMHLDGYKFWLAHNGVWLAERVPPIYLTKIAMRP